MSQNKRQFCSILWTNSYKLTWKVFPVFCPEPLGYTTVVDSGVQTSTQNVLREINQSGAGCSPLPFGPEIPYVGLCCERKKSNLSEKKKEMTWRMARSDVT